MYKVIIKRQRTDYNWEKQTAGLFITKEEAFSVHDREALISRALLGRNEIIDYQIETIERWYI